MVILIIVSIAVPVCLVMVVITCLNCFQKPKFQNFQNRESTRAQNNPSFTVDITDSQDNEHVAIEPLPDILAKNSSAAPSRPKIICSERGKQDATLSLISVHRSFPREQIQYLNELESGWFGKVLDSEATQIVSGSEKSRVMVKMLKDDASKQEQKQFLDEVLAFRCLQHANVLGLLGQCIETTPFLILLEFAPHGNLKTFLSQRRLEVEAMMKRHMFLGFALDAAAGLACLHRHGYIHNDLAARNCLVMSDYSVKIGDYGVSEVLFKEDYMASGSDLLPIRWMAPESLIQSQGIWTAQPGDKVSDMWAFGILLWEIFSFGDRPYDMLTDEAMLQGVVLDKLVKPAELDTRLEDRDKLWQLMGQCWQDPAQRVQIEPLYQQLYQLTSARRDTFEVSIDFDQRWQDLEPNKRASSVDTDLGSRIALAGSFAGSTTTERSSVASVSTEVVSERTSSSGSKVEPVVAENSPALDAQQVLDGSGDTSKAALTGVKDVENMEPEVFGSGDAEKVDPSSAKDNEEPISEPESQQIDLTPLKPAVVASSTPSDSKGDETSEFFSPLTSTPASLYSTAIETSGTSIVDSDDSGPQGNTSTFESIISEVEVTFAESQTLGSDESQRLSGEFSNFVRTSPTVKSLDFGDFESSQSGIGAEVTVEKQVSVPEGFSDFEGASDNFSTIETKDVTTEQHQEVKLSEPQAEDVVDAPPQSLTLQFDSLNLDSLAEEKTAIPSFAAGSEPQDVQSPDLLTPVVPQIPDDRPAEELLTPNSGPLLDEDVDQLVPSSYQPAEDLLGLGSISVASLPSEPALLLPAEKAHVPTPEPLAFTDVPEQQQSLTQNLPALPAFDPSSDTQDKSKESLIAALGESLESQPKSEVPSGNLLEDTVAADSSDFEKVGTVTARESQSHAPVHSLSNTTDLNHPTPSSVLQENSPLRSSPEIQQAISPFLYHPVQISSDDSCFQNNDETDCIEPHRSGTVSNTQEPALETDKLGQLKEKFISPDHFVFSSVPTFEDGHLFHNKWNLHKVDQLINSGDTQPVVLSEHQKAVEPELLSPDDDTTADSGIHSGRQEHFSDSADDDDDNDDDNDVVEKNYSSFGFARTESPLNTVSPADSDSDVSSSSTSTSGSSGGEYSCDTGHHKSTPSPDTGQKFVSPLDTGQSYHPTAASCKSSSESEQEILERITDFYLSKGVKSPRTFEMRPLETIPEDQVLSSPSLYRENSIATPSDTSSLEVKYEDLFGSDGFEWDDDLCGDDSLTENLRTSPETVASSGPHDEPIQVSVVSPTISSTRQALNQILSRTGLLNKRSASSSDSSSHRHLNSLETSSLSHSTSSVTPSPTQTGLSSASPHLNRNERLGAEISSRLYSLAEDYSFDSDSLSEVGCDISSVHSFDIHDEAEDSDNYSPGSPPHSHPTITPSSFLSPELAIASSSSHKTIVISGNACGTDPLLPSHWGKETKLSHADEVQDSSSSSMGEWDLLGLESSPTSDPPSTANTAKENSSSSSEPNTQATLIDLL
ncbi:serine/threonine-protein kinase LMTK1 [Elysia marginata]|uniref:Serine/threonine-protein kinase LMTK1 n=1 Tax=Elysia marginata TaxID=1093978 RepID=A0AAV4IUY1_9GAST|nr:serine/threonine-protein kinase LMTK1 [Elysia marginata]